MMVRNLAFQLIALCAVSMAYTYKTPQVSEPGFAVVELFTSEGCSSCPPADALIGKIQKEYKDKPVYILAYHVDYWDRLGWKDTFSDKRYSQRQNQYANWFRSNSIYTPQIVINGSREFVGSDEKALRNALTNALSKTTKGRLEISVIKQRNGNLTLNYRSNQQTQGYNLLVALVTPNATNRIQRGENKGKTLSHVQVVRSLQLFSLTGKENGMVDVVTGKEILLENMKIIAFLQNGKTGEITSASKIN